MICVSQLTTIAICNFCGSHKHLILASMIIMLYLHWYPFAGVEDYSPVSNIELLFQPASASQPQCVDIQLVDDSVLENNETFLVTLSSSDSAVLTNPNAATVTINNDDGKMLQYTLQHCTLKFIFFPHNRN